MTVKVLVLYTQPADADAFDRRYHDEHVPLMHKIPGLKRAETGKIVAAADRGELTYFRIAELYFDDQDALSAAFASPEGNATSAHYQEIAPPGSRLFVTVLDD
jgi:uncharacterized protein (TIGR02118 family)